MSDRIPTINEIRREADRKDKEASQFERRKKKRDQTARISGAIIVNALLFQERIAQAQNHQQNNNL